jgi:hypothetical protein
MRLIIGYKIVEIKDVPPKIGKIINMRSSIPYLFIKSSNS